MFKFKKECNRVYSLCFDTQEEMCKAFLRYQEYYESPKFQHNKFTIEKFKRWYIKESGTKRFTYYKDWDGFNLNVSTIFKVHDMGIEDVNEYDHLMYAIADLICKDYKGKKECYLIGVYGENPSAYKHEMAHSLFYIDSKYKNGVIKLISKLPEEIRAKLSDNLDRLGYAESSVIDEIQAYSIDNCLEFIWIEKKVPKELSDCIDKIIKLYEERKKILKK